VDHISSDVAHYLHEILKCFSTVRLCGKIPFCIFLRQSGRRYRHQFKKPEFCSWCCDLEEEDLPQVCFSSPCDPSTIFF